MTKRLVYVKSSLADNARTFYGRGKGLELSLMVSRRASRLVVRVSVAALVATAAGAAGCSDPEAARVKSTTQASYDFDTGKLTEITYDQNKNGRIDTWTSMDGARPVSSRLDTNEDGQLDRWETYGPDGKLVEVAWERAPVPSATDPAPKFTGKPNATAKIAADGSTTIEYYETSDVTGQKDITRREFYTAAQAMTHAEEDSDGDGLMDRFETYVDGLIRTVEFDEKKPYDGKPDRRMTYSADGGIVLIETEPDGKGGYLKKVVPGG
jgi:hypothetical protein